MKQLHLQAVKSKLFEEFWMVNTTGEPTAALLCLKDDNDSDVLTIYKN